MHNVMEGAGRRKEDSISSATRGVLAPKTSTRPPPPPSSPTPASASHRTRPLDQPTFVRPFSHAEPRSHALPILGHAFDAFMFSGTFMAGRAFASSPQTAPVLAHRERAPPARAC